MSCAERIPVPLPDGGEISFLFERPDVPGRVPCVLFIHGGGWDSCSADYYLRHMEIICRRGAAAASAEYRLKTPDTHVSRLVYDCGEIIRYMRKNAEGLGILENMICVAGESAGGHLALCLSSPLIVPDDGVRPDLTLNLNGVVDMTGVFSDRFFSEEEQRSCTDPGRWLDIYGEAENWSPAFRVSAGNSPTVHFHGLLDRVVRPGETVRYHRELLSHGVPSELHLLPGMNHAFILFDYDNPDGVVYSILDMICGTLLKSGWLKQ